MPIDTLGSTLLPKGQVMNYLQRTNAFSNLTNDDEILLDFNHPIFEKTLSQLINCSSCNEYVDVGFSITQTAYHIGPHAVNLILST